MAAQDLSASTLGKLAKVAANTVGNYLRATAEEADASPSRGKERSAKLTEVERIANALRIDPVDLFRNQDEKDDAGTVVLTPDDLLLLQVAASLDAEDRAFLFALAQRLAICSTGGARQ